MYLIYHERGALSIVKRKTTTSTEVKNRWNAKTYARYQVNLRRDEDTELIQFIEENKDSFEITEIYCCAQEEAKPPAKPVVLPYFA